MAVDVSLPVAATEPGAAAGVSPRLRRLWITLAAVGVLLFTFVGTRFVTDTRPAVAPCLAIVAMLAGVLLLLVPRLPAQTRAELALVVQLTVFVAFPITRLTSASTRDLEIFIGLLAVIALTGLLGGQVSPAPGRLVMGLLGLDLLVATAVFGSKGGLLLLVCRSLVPGVSCFFLVRRLQADGLRRVCAAVLTLAAVESGLAIVEPFAFAGHLWAPAALDAQGAVSPLLNELLGSSMDRSQATMGHPLPLGFLLAVGLAICVRAIDVRPGVRAVVTLLLLTGLVFSGSRNSLIIAVALLLFFGARRLSAPRLFTVSALFIVGLLVASLAGLFGSSAVSDFAASGSYTHRLAAYGAFGQLLSGQSLLAAVVGNGYGSTQRLFEAGLLQTDGFNVVDNQFVLMLSQGGLVSLVTFAALSLTALLGPNWRWRGVVIVVVANSVIFDWFSWPSCSSLGLFCVGAALSNYRGTTPSIQGSPRAG